MQAGQGRLITEVPDQHRAILVACCQPEPLVLLLLLLLLVLICVKQLQCHGHAMLLVL